MSSTREFDFDVNISSATLPDPATPSASADLITKAYADANYGSNVGVLSNVGLAVSTSSNILTAALKQKDGSTNATSTAPVQIGIKDLLVQGKSNVRSVTGALSMTLTRFTTLGIAANTLAYLWWYLIDTDGAGTMALGCSTKLWDEASIQSPIPESFTATYDKTSGVWTKSGHGLVNGDAITLRAGTSVPTGYTAGTTYYVINAGVTFKLSATSGGSAVTAATDNGSGIQTIHIAGNRLVTDASIAYNGNGMTVRVIGRSSVNMPTPGDWQGPNDTSVAAPFSKNISPSNTIRGNNQATPAESIDLTVAQAQALLVPLTTKGDVLGFSTIPARLGVGTDGQALVADSSKATGLKWGTVSGGGGSKNYLAAVVTSNGTNTGNGDLELNATTGFSLGTVTLTSGIPTGVPTFGSGASGNLSIAVITASQLAGLCSLNYSSSAATTAGNFVATDAFNIDTEDQAKVLTFKIYYKAASGGSNANWSGASSNSFGVAIYDVTNSAWIIPAGCFGMTQSSGVGLVTGTFQTTSNSTQYRLVLYNANATSGAVGIYLDDFSVGPQTAPIGSVVTDPVAYTPTATGFGTLTAAKFEYSRVGKYLRVDFGFTTGTVTGTTASISLPSGLNIDTTLVSGNNVVGVMGNNSAVADCWVFTQTGTSTSVVYLSKVNTGGLSALAGNASPFANSQSQTGYFEVPIVGWSSNVQMSNDTDTRVVAFRSYGTATGTLTTSYNDVSFPAAATDTHSGFNGTTTYTVQVSGLYDIVASLSVDSAASSALGANGVYCQVLRNGSLLQLDFVGFPATGAGGVWTPKVIANGVQLIAGDALKVQTKVVGGSSISWDSFSSFQVSRKSGPSVIAATESINMRYGNNSGQSIPSATPTAITGWTKAFDSHGSMNASTGVYTFNTPGKYLVGGALQYAVNATGARGILLLVTGNDAGQFTLQSIPSAGAATDVSDVGGVVLINVLPGDTATIQAFQRSGGSLAIQGGAAANFFFVARVGN